MICLLLSLLFTAPGMPEEDPPIRPTPDVFIFDSGGATHPAGHGAWTLTLSSYGELNLVRILGDERREWKDLTVANEQNSAVWNLLLEMDLDDFAFAERPGLPDEVRLNFKVMYAGGLDETQALEAWNGDVAEVPRLVELLELLEELIEDQTGCDAVLR